jgi:filamentous hemagglutinin family protein
MKIRQSKFSKSRRGALRPVSGATTQRPARTGTAGSDAARLGAILLTGSFAVAQVPVYAAGGSLPVPCAGAHCVGATGKSLGWDLLGTHSTITTGANSLVINQGGNSAIFNWQSFNISAGNTVQFIQPSASSVALNRIFDPNVTTISGNLKANGQVYLINPNGILFGSGANVDVGGLIAATSNMNNSRVTSGLLSDPSPNHPVLTSNLANLDAVSAADSPLASAGANPQIVVQSGASLYAAGRDASGTVVSAGRVFLFAPTVENAGKITVDGGGQVILGAGSDVYLGSSTDVSLRGLLVELTGSSAAGVTVDASGNISVARGNITLMGLAVNQAGTLTATSALDANGSIRLVARQADPADYTSATLSNPKVLLPIAETGTVNIATGSHTQVVLDPTDTATAPLNDATAAATRSTIDIEGGAVNIGANGAGSTLIQAHGGDVTVTARASGLISPGVFSAYNSWNTSLLGSNNAAGIINVGSNATIDVSGLLNVAVDGGREFVNISRLTSTNLANAPYQRTGFLLGKSVWLNLEKAPSWLDVSALQNAVAGTQAERNSVGGTVALRAEGSVNLAKGSTINVSGGSTYLTAAVGRTSQLITATGAVVDISNATADTQYVGFADQASYTSTDTREGVNATVSWQTPVYTQLGGYTLGANAGTVQIYAPAATLGGTLLGQTITTAQQRSAPPLGGRLQIGSSNPAALDQDAGIQRANILLGANAQQLAQGLSPDLKAGLKDPNSPVIALNTTSLGQGGFTRLDLTSDGVIELAPGAALNLGAGGQFTARANAVAIDSSISAAGGSINIAQRPLSPLLTDLNSSAASQEAFRDQQSLVATSSPLFGSVGFAPGTHVSTAGLWTNDSTLTPSTVATAPVVLNGGSISVSGASVDVSGASFDVSSGAWLSQSGLYTGGAGGSLALTALPSAPGLALAPTTPQLVLGADFAARIAGYGGTKAGSLAFNAWALQLGTGTPADPSAVLIDPAIGQRGFGAFQFNAFNSVAVAPGTVFAPQPVYFQNSAGLRYAASDSSLLAVSTPQSVLPGTLDPTSIGIKASNPFGGTVTVGQGAVIDAGATGSIALTGFNQVMVDGALRAQAGTVALALGNADQTAQTLQSLEARAIQMGPQSTIDVSGVSLATLRSNGLVTGNVLDAGSVSIDATLGIVAMDPGARILAQGTHATVDIAQQGNQYLPQTVASAGGTVEVSATNGIYLEGTIDGHGGSATANGGKLSVALQAVSPNTSDTDAGVLAQVGLAENLSITNSLPVLVADQASFPLTGGQGGPGAQGVVTPGLVNKSGFEQVWLQSADTITLAQSMSLGAASVNGAPYGLNSLVLAGRAIDLAPGANVTLSAGYVALGGVARLNAATNGYSNFSATAPVGSSGTGTLTVTAEQIDLVGRFALQGVSQTRLDSTGDVRGLGEPGALDTGSTNVSRATGALSFGGNLAINAAQLYPATQTDFTVSAADPAAGQIVVSANAPAAAPLAPLSAGGSLTFNATGFTSSGRVEAPLGTIAVNAGSITLDAGSTLSVAGSGLVPYGTVNNGTVWTYGVPPGNQVAVDPYTLGSTAGTTLPAKGISLNAPAGALDARPGSTVSVAGGGDVLGTGFVAGPGGAYDMSLNFPYGNGTRNPYFALVPSRGAAAAAFDPQAYADLVLDQGLPASASAQFAMGQTVTIGAGSSLPAGTYTVLPIRYALLPGAYAVEAVSGYQNLASGSSVTLPDGSTIVAGRLGFAAAGTSASLDTGFRVYTDAQFRSFSEFHDYLGSQFFATAAADAGQVQQRLAQDAGQLQIDASAIRLAGTLDTAPAAGGRGAEVAIDAPDIVVADGASTAATPQGTLQLDAAALSRLGAETLILGAVDGGSGSNMVLGSPVASNSVTVQAAAPLSAGQLVIASNTVEIGAAAHLVALAGANGTVPPTTSIAVSGDGAGLVVSSGALPSWNRGGASPAGTATVGNLDVASGARISGNSVLFDATAAQTYGAGLALSARNLEVDAALVNLGNVPAGTSGLNLSAALLSTFASAQNLTIASQGGIDVYGTAVVGSTTNGTPSLDTLTLIGPGIAGFGATTDSLALNAGHVRLDNSAGAGLAHAASGGLGSLVVHATATAQDDGNIVVAGNIALDGFASAALTATGRSVSPTQTAANTGDLLFAGSAGASAGLALGGAGSTLAIDSTRITAQRGVNAAITVPGALTIAATAPAPVSVQSSELGASLAISAQSVDMAGRIDLPAGVVRISATGTQTTDGVTLESGASIRVAGETQKFASTTADVSAGGIALSSASGSVAERAGSTLDLSGAGTSGDAGTLILAAANGTATLDGSVLAQAGSAARGANFSVDAGTVANLSGLAQTFNTAAGTAVPANSIDVRARGGNLAVQAGDGLRASHIVLEADGAGGAADGSITVAGRLDASGANGGTIALYGNDQVSVLSGAQIDAHATAAKGTGGEVLVSSRVVAAPAATLDAIVLQSGAAIDVAGGSAGTGGSVTLRAPRIGNDVAITAAAGTVAGTRALDGTVPLDAAAGVQNAVIIDAVQVYQETGAVTLDPSLATGVLTTAQADSQNYAAAALTPGTGIDTTRLALDMNLRPGIEIDTPGTITVSYAPTTGLIAPVLDFAATNAGGGYLWRYGGSTLATSTPGSLTLRAGGGIAVNTSISDGFDASVAVNSIAVTNAKPYALNGSVATSGESWSYLLTAGADLGAANPNQVQAGSGGNLTIGTQSAALPVTIRTGTGSIGLNAAQDVVLANGAGQQGNVVYTAGVGNVVALDGTGNPLVFPTLVSYNGNVKSTIPVVLTQYGGDLNISAGGDVLGTAPGANPFGSRQSVSDWLLRGGEGNTAAPSVWWVDFANFQQGFGALGGGNLTLAAGGSAVLVGAAVASNGYDAGAGLSERNTGALNVTVGGVVQQGLYYDQAGTARLQATSFSSDNSGANLGAQGNVQLAQGSGSIDLQARETAQFDASFNPTFVAASALETGTGATGTIRTQAASPEYQTGFLTFGQDSGLDARVSAGDLTLSQSTVANGNITAPSVELVAFGGSVLGSRLILGTQPNTPSGVVLAPSATGQVDILSDGSISGLSLLMSQADPAVVPSVVAPQVNALGNAALVTPLFLDSGNSGAALHAADPRTAEIVARTGSINDIYLDIPKTTEIAAGGNIGGGGNETAIYLQNSNANSLSTVSAGGSILFASGSAFDGITIGGPGALQVIAAGGINLGSSGTGIVSTGNLNNPNLATAGATLIVAAGAGRSADGFAATPDYTGAIENFIQYDAFASTGTAAPALNQQVITALAKDPALQALVTALKAGLGDRSGALASPGSAFALALAKLTPEQLAVGAVRLASAIQVVNNQVFVQSANSETFAPAYLAFADLFPGVSNNAGAIRQFILNNVFANAPNGAALRAQALQGLPADLVSVIDQGLAAPGTVDQSGSAFSKALAALDPAVLAAGTRQLYANVLVVAGASETALKASGSLTGSGSPYAKELTAFAQALAPTTAAGIDDLQMDYSQIKAQSTGDVAVFAPQGGVIVGQSSPPALTATKTPDELGIFTYGAGDIIGMARDSVDVFRSRVFTVAGGDIDLWSSLANLDAGRGPRDVAVVPPPRLVANAAGVEQLDVSATVSGSGIGALETEPNQPPSNINLMAPAGYVDAGEAGIRASTGTVTLGTNLVLNAGNITAASGVSGGAVVAAPPPPPPPSTGSSASDRVVEDAQREAVAQAQAAAVAAGGRRLRIIGEFIGFEDCSDASREKADCTPAGSDAQRRDAN